MSNILKSKKISGGGLFKKTRHHMLKKKWPEYYYILKHTMASEKELIKVLKKYTATTQKYFEKYYQHLDNLSRLDSMFENFDSFKKSFEIVFEEFKDKKEFQNQALLLSNYNKLEPFSQPEDIIKHHLVQQVVYLLFKYYNQYERLLIKQIIIQDVLKKPKISVVGSDNYATEFVLLPHNKYQIDFDKTKEILDKSVSYMKKKLEIIPSHPERQILGVDKVPVLPRFNPLQLDVIKKQEIIHKTSHKKNPSIKKGSIKKGSIKKGSIKKGSIKKYEGKKINEIKVPTDVPILPVLKVELPKKVEGPGNKKVENPIKVEAKK